MAQAKRSKKHTKKNQNERESRIARRAGYGMKRVVTLIIVGMVILGLVGSSLLALFTFLFA